MVEDAINFGQVNSGWIKVQTPIASLPNVTRKYEKGLGWFTVSGIQDTEDKTCLYFEGKS